MLHVAINPEVEKILAEIAAKLGETPDDIARRALLAYLEDLEDYVMAVEAWKEHDPATSVPIEELLARYGVED